MSARGPGRQSHRRVPFEGYVAAALVVCGLVALLPDTMPWWPLKLAVATYTVLLVPGAAILRVLGWPGSPAAALAAAAAWSMAALAPGLVLVFVLETGIDLVLGWLLAVTVAALFAGRGKPVAMDARATASVLVFLGATVAFMVVVALVRHNNAGDAMEHVARVRKLTELVPLRGLSEVNLLPPDTGLHPGYAFPLWHAVIGAIVRISGVDEAVAFRSLSPLLVPVVAAAVYRAGRSAFGCRAAGAATWLAYLALFAFPYAGVGYFNKLSYPGNLSILLLWPLVIDRMFVHLRSGNRESLWTIAATSFVVALVHASYNPLMMLVVGAFAATRFIVVRRRSELPRLIAVGGALSLPFLLLLIWLYPIARSGGASPLALDLSSYETLLVQRDGLIALKASWVTRGGAAAVAALLLAPLAVAATRTRAAAFVGAGTVLVILVLIVPWLFTPFSDIVSVSQGRRLLHFLPWGLALVGGALVLARFRQVAVAGALVAGAGLQLLVPGDFSYRLVDPGPGWVAWVAVAGVVVVLGAGLAGRLHATYCEAWTLPIVAAFVLPVAVGGLPSASPGVPDVTALPKPVVTAVRQHVDRDDVLMAPLRTAYELSGQAPIYIVAATRGHSADTLVNRHGERRADVGRFFDEDTPAADAREILRRWDVSWVLVDKAVAWPQAALPAADRVFDGTNYALYAVEPGA